MGVGITQSLPSCACNLSLNVLCHTIPHELCSYEAKDVHSLQSFVSTHSDESDNVLFILCFQRQMLATFAFSKQNSVNQFQF